MAETTTLVWLRNDLRMADNPALHFAAEQGTVIPLYIIDDSGQTRPLGEASNWWLHHSLSSLNTALSDSLVVKKGDPLTIINELCSRYNVNTVVWNRNYSGQDISRDSKIKAALAEQDIQCKSFNGNLLWEPMSVLKKDGTPYKVFTPYYRKGCLAAAPPRFPLPAPKVLALCQLQDSDKVPLADFGLLPSINWDASFTKHWEPGEAGGHKSLESFVKKRAVLYKQKRDFPSSLGTSKLSPHLRFGEVSPNQIWYSVLDNTPGLDNPDTDCYLSELGWREFSYYLLHHFPTMTEENFNPKFNVFPWKKNESHLSAWQKGQTGIPIVDAGMRELWQTGYMHNRVRMIVGSFLVKNLLTHWREGEAWFWDTLLDADLSSNTASWQWVAGTGADAAPYFRIFNPILQGEKFDKQGEYVKTYCPELRRLPDKFIHKPWEAPSNILQYAKVVLGKTYPKPVVDLKLSRQHALDAFAQTKEGN